MDNVTPLRKQSSLFGPPVTGHRCVIDGRVIPKLIVHQRGNDVEFVIDGRFSCIVPDEYAHPVAHAIANALAIGAGYPSANAEDQSRPFAPKLMHL